MVIFQYNSPQRIKPLQKRERERETYCFWPQHKRRGPGNKGPAHHTASLQGSHCTEAHSTSHTSEMEALPIITVYINQSDSFKIMQPLQTPNRLSSGPYLGCATRANLSPSMEPWFAMFSFFHPNTSNDQRIQLAREVNIKMWTIQK